MLQFQILNHWFFFRTVSEQLCYTKDVFDDEYDSEKSDWSKKNRGINFLQAREVWLDPEAVEGPGNIIDGENRWLKVGLIEKRLWTVVFTIRHEKIRIISVRPPHKDEKDAYYG